MFRFFKPRQTVLSLSRLPLKLELQTHRGPPPNIQVVRFKKPGIRPRSILMSACMFMICYSTYNRIVLDPLERAAMEALKNIPEKELQNEDEPIFIPFPGTTKQINPPPYRGSDPEWQEFIKFNKDRELAKHVRQELAEFVRLMADRHPMLTMKCGKGMKLRRYWLDVDFPRAPPPMYVRSGIEITDDYIAWTTMPVDSSTVFKIRRAFWPSPLAQSFWAFTKVLVAQEFQQLANILGIKTEQSSPAFDPIEMLRQRQLQRPNPAPSPNGPPKQPTLTDAATAMGSMSFPPKTPMVGKDSQDVDTTAGPATKVGMSLHAHFMRPIMAFKMKLAQTWRSANAMPPRGSVIVSGMVEINAPKAWLVFDVTAAWDPKTKAYDTKSLVLRLRRVQMKKQWPAGGT
ncbi:hypothetical protein F5884DRAFT_778527 [Xylogone sp. PMI_703]|nr:hypothetical protein F5884DRAFT_778527 [Xylogone sp. PMI_703]